MSNEAFRVSAVSNALSSIRRDKRFPQKVLAGHWEDYLFFEPFLMFDPCFIEIKNSLLVEEKASVIALINLGDDTPINHDDPPMIFIEQSTMAKEYISELESRGAPRGWRFVMDRYVCASDRGAWCIYCERQNDVAVFAFREGFLQSTRLQVEKLLKTTSIRFSSATGATEVFDFGKLVPSWRSALVAEHVPVGPKMNSRGSDNKSQ